MLSQHVVKIYTCEQNLVRGYDRRNLQKKLSLYESRERTGKMTVEECALSFSMPPDIATGTQVEQSVGHGLSGHLEPETPGSHRGRASTPPGSARVVGSVLGQARNAA